MPTNFEDISFNQKYHTYTCNGHKLTSVTKLAYSLKPAFDREGVAAKKARETGQSVAEILAEWDTNRNAALARGTLVHEWIAGYLLDQLPPASDPFLALNERLPEMDGFETLWGQLSLKAALQHAEWVVGDEELGIAGTVDALLLSNDGDRSNLWDWKTGKEFKTENRFQNLLPPFDDLPDSDLSAYSLQLSLYRLIIERNTSLEIGDCYIAHLDPVGGYRIHKALDLRERVERWLKTR